MIEKLGVNGIGEYSCGNDTGRVIEEDKKEEWTYDCSLGNTMGQREKGRRQDTSVSKRLILSMKLRKYSSFSCKARGLSAAIVPTH